MKRIFIIALTLTMGFTFSNAQIKMPKIKLPTGGASGLGAGLSETDIANGLKQALTIGAQKASEQLNKTDGFNGNPLVRIPFPPDAAKAATELRKLGYGQKVDDFELSLNRSAEEAAKEAAPIFTNAVKEMSITDAKNILTGSDTAATAYLRKQTYSSLFTAFTPPISTALKNNDVASKWSEITTIYNKIPLVKKVNTDLVSYATNMALKGVFIVVAQEELKIRQDPAAQVTDILKKVFGGK
jgi:hypothetical protein